MTERSFPPKPAPSLARADVIAYLVELEEQGWDVYRGDGETFVVKVGEMQDMIITPPAEIGTCRVGTNNLGLTSSSAVETFGQFEQIMNRFFKGPPRVTATRLNSGEPATNVRRIVRLIGSHKVEGVYDPWLDDEGLGVLLSVLRMSKSASSNLRLITGKSGAKNLTPHFAKLVFQELRCANGRLRRTTNQDPHDRLLQLSRGKSIHIGPSWNSMNKAGQVSIHDSAKDRAFFETEWSAAVPIVSTGPLAPLAKKLSG